MRAVIYSTIPDAILGLAEAARASGLEPVAVLTPRDVRSDGLKREQAWRITMSYLADAFPRHFQQPGLQARE